MGALFSSPKYPNPEPPAPMPDANDPLAARRRRQQGGTLSPANNSSTADRLAPVPGTIGREFSRSTLGSA